MSDIRVRRLGFETVYNEIWDHMGYEDEVTMAIADLPEGERDAAEEREATARSDAILEAMGKRAYEELRNSFINGGNDQFLKGFLKAMQTDTGAYVNDKELLELLKKFD